MRHFASVVLLSIFTFVTSAQTVKMFTVPRSLIEARVNTIPRKNNAREQLLKTYFEQSGCAGDQLAEQPVKHAKVPNLICTAPGDTDRVIVVGAHLDFVDIGEGAIDNWSGASLLASLFASLKNSARRHRFVFIAFTDEEQGLVGSKFYVKSLGSADRRNISAMINMDSLGLSPTKVDVVRVDDKLLNPLSVVAGTLHLPLSAVNFHKVGLSDSDTFLQENIPAICLHSVTQDTYHLLHSSDDRPKFLKMADYYDSYRLIATYLAYLDQVLDPPSS